MASPTLHGSFLHGYFKGTKRKKYILLRYKFKDIREEINCIWEKRNQPPPRMQNDQILLLSKTQSSSLHNFKDSRVSHQDINLRKTTLWL